MLRPTIIVALALIVAPRAHAQLQPTAAPPLTVECDDLELPSLAQAIEAELPALQRSRESWKLGAATVSPADYATRTLKPILELAKKNDRANLCGALMYKEAWLSLGDKLLITAYHTPTVKGSLTQDETYRYPLYKRPKDAALAHLSTAQILAGGLANRGLEVVWLADAYDALALHVEGAGVVELPDGARLQVGSDGHNGRAYQNVSKLLLADGKLQGGAPPASHQPGNPKARAYFATHPLDLNVYWGRNEHFVFFRRVEKAGGGKFGTLIAGRSVAVDADRVPLGTLLFVKAQKPIVENGAITGWQPFTRIVVGQDTGAGIKGARMDMYFGDDDYALAAAQAMSVPGSAWVLMSR
jgi:membrane-bound lytic murein transglycosylase A